MGIKQTQGITRRLFQGKSPKEEASSRAKRRGVLFEVEIKFIHIVIGKYYVSPHRGAVVAAVSGQGQD